MWAIIWKANEASQKKSIVSKTGPGEVPVQVTLAGFADADPRAPVFLPQIFLLLSVGKIPRDNGSGLQFLELLRLRGGNAYTRDGGTTCCLLRDPVTPPQSIEFHAQR